MINEINDISVKCRECGHQVPNYALCPICGCQKPGNGTFTVVCPECGSTDVEKILPTEKWPWHNSANLFTGITAWENSVLAYHCHACDLRW